MIINEIKKILLYFLTSYAAIKKKWMEGKWREEIEGNVSK